MFNLVPVFQALNSVFGRQNTVTLVNKAVTRIAKDNHKFDAKIEKIRKLF